MACEADLIFLCDRNHAVEKICDAFPVFVGVDGPSFGQRRILFRFVVNESAVFGTATSFRRFRAHDTKEGHVVFECRYPCAGCVPNHLAYVVDFPIPLWTLTQHDIGKLCLRDVVRTHWQRHDVEYETKRLNTLTEPRKTFHRPTLIKALGRKPAADVIHSESCEDAEDFVRIAMLRPNLHQNLPRFRIGITRLATGHGGYLVGHNSFRESTCGNPTASDTHELPAIHRHLLPLPHPRQ